MENIVGKVSISTKFLTQLGVCNCDTYVSHLTDREKEIYWAAGLDGSKILMKWNSILGQGNSSLFPSDAKIIKILEGTQKQETLQIQSIIWQQMQISKLSILTTSSERLDKDGMTSKL